MILVMSRAILVVEDDFDVREALCAVLNDEGFTVHAASGGRDALAILRAGAQTDLIPRSAHAGDERLAISAPSSKRIPRWPGSRSCS